MASVPRWLSRYRCLLPAWAQSLGPIWKNQSTNSYIFSSNLQTSIVECVHAHTINKLDVMLKYVKWEHQLLILDPCLRFCVHYGAQIVIWFHTWISTVKVPEGSPWACGYHSFCHMVFLDLARELALWTHEAGCLGRSLAIDWESCTLSLYYQRWKADVHTIQRTDMSSQN